MTDCPICIEPIICWTKNCVTTECGHCFHTNCLMQSVAHNGFGCPYCRSKMAEEPINDDEEESVYSEDEEGTEMFDDDALRGFRFFFNNINGEDHDLADIDEEEEFKESDDEEHESVVVPSTDFVAQKLRQQGVTFEQLVKILCLDHAEYDDDEITENLSNDLFGKIRIIVSNYSPHQQAQEELVTTSVIQASGQDADFAAQAKNVTVRRMIYEE